MSANVSCASAPKSLCKSIESLLVSDIRLTTPAVTDSQFVPGNSINERTLRIVFNTDVPFPLGSQLHARLTASIDSDNVKTPIEPNIKTILTITSTSNAHTIEFTGSQIPLPQGIMFISNNQECPPTIEAGAAQKYVILLSTSRFACGAISCPAMPLIARVLTGAVCDIKCEMLSTTNTPDPDYPIQIYCDNLDQFVYAQVPHCVTHCQAPRPILQYYAWSSNLSENVPRPSITHLGAVCCKSCN